jgi:hypothetical protein
VPLPTDDIFESEWVAIKPKQVATYLLTVSTDYTAEEAIHIGDGEKVNPVARRYARIVMAEQIAEHRHLNQGIGSAYRHWPLGARRQDVNILRAR